MATLLTDLPEDVFSIICSSLPVADFLSLCRVNKGLYQHRYDPTYWRTTTSSTFRLPISPLLTADGVRWYYLYKRLKTQTTLYTWGQGLQGNLGRGMPLFRRGRLMNRVAPVIPRPATFSRSGSSWPTETHVPDEIKVISDLQCGGWSTSILSSDGKIYVVGCIDRANNRYIGESTEQFRRLEYLDQKTSAIKQFSSGRAHILGLTDDGDILSWDRIDARGLKIFSRHEQNFGRPSRVVAGWADSSAYVPDTGIIYWSPIENENTGGMLDGLPVNEHIIPGTHKLKHSDGRVVEVLVHVALESYIIWITSDSKLWACNIHVDHPDDQTPSQRPFEVPGYSSSNRTFRDLHGQYNKFAVFTENGEVLSGNTDYLKQCADAARDSQSDDDDVDKVASPSTWPNIEQLIALRPIDHPALQHSHVIKIAFGDHHYHALHANGKITSHGSDPDSVGALGLGTVNDGGRFRGLRIESGFRPSTRLIPDAENRGRHVWFEPEKRDWLRWMQETLTDGTSVGDITDAAGEARGPLFLWEFDIDKQFKFSEWVEQEGKHWNDGPLASNSNTDKQKEANTTTSTETKIQTQKQKQEQEQEQPQKQDDFPLDPYFAISIAAAGWHSGALVLVDAEKAQETRQKWTTTVPNQTENQQTQQQEQQNPTSLIPGHFETTPDSPEETYIWKLQGFPKVVLPDGFEMPGVGDVRPWRDGVPVLD